MKHIAMLSFSNCIRHSPFASAHSTDPYAFANWQKESGNIVHQVVYSEIAWHMDNYPDKLFYPEQKAKLLEMDMLVLTSSVALQGFAKKAVPKQLNYTYDLLDSTDCQIGILLQDPRPEFMLHWLTTFREYSHRFVYYVPGTAKPHWLKDEQVVTMGVNYSKWLGHHLPGLWQQGEPVVEQDIDCLFTGIRFDDDRIAFIDKYLNHKHFKTFGLGPTYPHLPSCSSNQYLADYVEVYRYMQRAKVSLFISTSWHKDCGLWLTTRFWQGLLAGGVLLIPAEEEPAVRDWLLQQDTGWEEHMVCDASQVYKVLQSLTRHRNAMLLRQWKLFCHLMKWPC